MTIRSNDFKNKSHQQKLREPTDGTNEIYQLAKKLFSELWNGKTPLRLLGIALTDLTKEDFVQTSMFDTADERKTKSKKLDKTVDALRSKYGRSTIQRGALLQDTHEVGKKYTAQMEQKTTSELITQLISHAHDSVKIDISSACVFKTGKKQYLLSVVSTRN